jgi:hypothetical protein
VRRRLLPFAGSAVVIEHDGPAAAGVVEFLFAAHLAGDPPRDEPIPTFTLGPGDGSERLSLLQNGTRIYEGFGRGVAAELLLAHASRSLAEHSSGGMLLHAAALEWNDAMVLMPAGIGGGKSTLTLWLASRGFRYLTDEMVFVPQGGGPPRPFLRPLSLKHPSRPVMEGSFDFSGNADQVLPSAESDLIHTSCLNPGSAEGTLPLKAIIFPRYSPDGEPSFEMLTPARTGHKIMQSLVNARNLLDHGFGDAVALAKSAPGYRAAYSRFDQIATSLDETLGVQPSSGRSS